MDGSYDGKATLTRADGTRRDLAADGTPFRALRRVMAEAMQDGAFGISYALIYPPESYADTDEIVEVAKVAGRYGGLYITHLRSEGDQFLEALEQVFGSRHGNVRKRADRLAT